MTKLLAMMLAALAMGATPAQAQAPTWPTKPIRLIVPFAAGGANDIVARLVQPSLEKALGQPVIVDNRPAASGTVGTDAVAKAEPDGHTLLMAFTTHTVNPAVNSKLPYDTERDLVPVILIGKNPLLFIVHAKVPAKSLAEFAALAKANAGKFNFAAATGTPPHILAFVFKELTGADFPVALYRGGSPAMADLFANQVHAIFQPTTIVIPILDDKRIRVLGIATEQRSSLMPDVPTLAEQGFPQLIANSWNGLAAPAGTPAPIVSRLNQAAVEAMNSAELKAKFGGLGITIIAGSPEQFGAFMQAEAIRWDGLVKAAKMPKA